MVWCHVSGKYQCHFMPGNGTKFPLLQWKNQMATWNRNWSLLRHPRTLALLRLCEFFLAKGGTLKCWNPTENWISTLFPHASMSTFYVILISTMSLTIAIMMKTPLQCFQPPLLKACILWLTIKHHPTNCNSPTSLRPGDRDSKTSVSSTLVNKVFSAHTRQKVRW